MRRLAFRVVLAGSCVLGLLLQTTVASAYVRYYATTDGLALRRGPGTQYPVIQRVNRGTPLDVACQIQGGTSVGGNRTWDRLTGNQWVPDYNTTSPSYNSYASGLGQCSSGGRLWGRMRNTNAASDSSQCTWTAYDRFKRNSGAYPELGGNANNWDNSARAQGWSVSGMPALRSIVVFEANRTFTDSAGSWRTFSAGHVAWVFEVQSRTDGKWVHIVERNMPTGRGERSDRWVKHVGTYMNYVLAPATP